MAQGKSNVWKFFKICNDEKKAECSLCDATSQKQIVRGKTPKLFSTKPLWNHLKSKHPLIVKTLEKNSNNDENNPLTSGLSTSGSSTTITSKSEPRLTQPTLQSVVKKKEMWSLNDPRSINLTKKIGMLYFYILESYYIFYYE